MVIQFLFPFFFVVSRFVLSINLSTPRKDFISLDPRHLLHVEKNFHRTTYALINPLFLSKEFVFLLFLEGLEYYLECPLLSAFSCPSSA